VEAERTPIRRFYPESAFGGFTRRDGTVAFYLRVNALLTPESWVLDVGCGRGEYADDPVAARRALRVLRGKCARVIGLDPDPAAQANPYLDEFGLLDEPHWPVDDGTIDLCLVDNVLEHVEHPDDFFARCRRVLRPGGFVCIRTPNAFGYAAVAARLVPNSVHSRVLRRVQPDRKEEDVFPTFYRCNTQRNLHERLRAAGFEACVYGHGAEPAYLGFSHLAYGLGVFWASVAPTDLQGTLFAFGRRLP
jgi:SAM-dependent methyltransferase